jgi:hypothetical protein
VAVYYQSRRWLNIGCFEAVVHDLRAVLSFSEGRYHEVDRITSEHPDDQIPSLDSHVTSSAHFY